MRTRSLQLLVPGTETDRVRTQLIEQLQVVFDKTVVPGAITLKPIGSFAGDPTAFQSMQKTSALLYLWSNNDTTEKRMLEYQLGRHLNFPVIGVVEACAMY